MPNFVHELTKDDVLLGRGTGPNEYQGNIRFRALVKETLRSNEFKKSTGSTKTMLARMIVRDVTAQNGRFLKKVGKSSKGRDLFAVVPDRVAVDKTRQSFRHQLRSMREPKTPEGKVEQKQLSLADASRGSFEKLLPSAKSDSSPVVGAKSFGVMKEDEAKSSALAAGSSSSGGLSSLSPLNAKITGLVDSGSSLASTEMRRFPDASWGGGIPPSFGSSSAGPTLIPLFEASGIAHRVACFNQQRSPQLPFPPSLGNEGRLERRMPFSSPNSALDSFRFGLVAPEHVARDLAYLEDLILLRAMTAHY
jgi:hypothetical protein